MFLQITRQDSTKVTGYIGIREGGYGLLIHLQQKVGPVAWSDASFTLQYLPHKSLLALEGIRQDV